MQEAAAKGLGEHLARHIANMRGARCGDAHVYRTEKRLEKLFRECGWKQLRDITADSFEAWRGKNLGKSAKTINDFLGVARTFLKGIVQKEWLEVNPLQSVKMITGKGKATLERRAFTDAEMRRLLGVAGPRQVVYLTAVQTGIRRGALGQLVWDDLILDSDLPQVRVRALTAKKGKLQIIPLCNELAAVLKMIRPVAVDGGDLVFHEMPSMAQFRADLKAADIEERNQLGQVVVFHSLRHTFITNLNRAGVAPRAAMELAGHSHMSLTMNVYTDANLLPLVSSVQKLPHFCGALPQMLPQATGANSYLLAQAGTEYQHAATHEEPANIGSNHALAEAGVVCHETAEPPIVVATPTKKSGCSPMVSGRRFR